MRKIVLKVDMDDRKRQKKVLMALCGLPGVLSIALSGDQRKKNRTLRHGRLGSFFCLRFKNPVDVDLIALYAKDMRKLTVTGEGVDPVAIVRTLRKQYCYAHILSVGPAIEPNERPVENIPRMTQSYSSSSSEESIRNY